jgi:hypothetical protein
MKVTSDDKGPASWLPETDLDPPQPPDAAQELALLVAQESWTSSPASTVFWLALKLIPGAGVGSGTGSGSGSGSGSGLVGSSGEGSGAETVRFTVASTVCRHDRHSR